MDELRIEAMMEFYKSLNIQLLIAVPTTKVPYISPYVDTNLVIDTVKYQTRAFKVETNLKDNYE